jgi:hypothetical protein
MDYATEVRLKARENSISVVDVEKSVALIPRKCRDVLWIGISEDRAQRSEVRGLASLLISSIFITGVLIP